MEFTKEKLLRIEREGFYNVNVNPRLDLFEAIEKLKKEKNAIILAHYYQDSDIQDIADYIGDSLGLAQQAEKTSADIILFAGVHFMAETAKILNPHKKVILPDLNAGCSLSDSCPPEDFAKFKAQHPDHKVVSYINCSAGIKALSDVIVTSSNAETIVRSFPESQKLIFAPDKNLGRYVAQKTGRDMILWNGSCMVHEVFSLKRILQLKEQYPEAEIIAHPECEEPILALANFIGSTTALLKYAVKSDSQSFIVVTESGILHQMEKDAPNKHFIPAPSEGTCACNSCPHMKLNTLEKIYIAMKYEVPEITMSEELMAQALIPIRRMLDISAQAGL
ncbi:MAG: quinolinate synthase NadA [Bacteroidia bacterium]|nr:quinolinate synthase NadA [Bacteroidia bacterium]